MKELSLTQDTPALSSGQAELAAAVRAVVEGLYAKHVMKFFEDEVTLELSTDSSAAIGTMARLGAGKRMRHVQTQQLYIQHLVKNDEVKVVKVEGTRNVADLGTKHLPRVAIDKILKVLGMVLLLKGDETPTAEAGELKEFRQQKEPSGRRTLGVVLEADDFELLGYGVMLGLFIGYCVLKLAQDVRALLQAVQDVKSVLVWLKSLCCGSRATPAQDDLDVNVEHEFPELQTKVFHVRQRPKAVHFWDASGCSQLHADSDVVVLPVCRTCLRKKRLQLSKDR